MKRNRGTCKAKTAEECFNCPLPECTRGCKKLIGEEEYIKIANLPVRGGIIPIAEDLKYARSERLV
jgi:hypothetical protein